MAQLAAVDCLVSLTVLRAFERVRKLAEQELVAQTMQANVEHSAWMGA